MFFQDQLDYPTNPKLLMSKKNSLLKELLAKKENRIQIKIAVLGGSTTSDLVKMLNLFLLYNGIEASFYKSEYNQYYEDVMFNAARLKEFKPDIIWLHTCYRNLKNIPDISDTFKTVEQKLEKEYIYYLSIWQKIKEDYNCIVIQNNFEQPCFRLMGNRDVSDVHGLLNFISSLNMKLYNYAQNNEKFFINDLNEIFCEVLDLDSLQLSDETTALDLDGWDSLSHISLIAAIETHFKIKLSMKEILSFQNIGNLVDVILFKLN